MDIRTTEKSVQLKVEPVYFFKLQKKDVETSTGCRVLPLVASESLKLALLTLGVKTGADPGHIPDHLSYTLLS